MPNAEPAVLTLTARARRHRRFMARAATGLCAALTLATVLMAGCASPPPPPRLMQLPLAAPGGAAPPATDGAAAWQLMPAAVPPEWQDSNTLLVADGGAGLRPLPGVRWAAPLRDVLPRLLLADLGRLRGVQSVWGSPAPPGLVIARQLRVEVLALDNDATASEVRLLARWTLADPKGRQTPLRRETTVVQPWRGGADALVQAQRAALWQLAVQIVRSAPAV